MSRAFVNRALGFIEWSLKDFQKVAALESALPSRRKDAENEIAYMMAIYTREEFHNEKNTKAALAMAQKFCNMSVTDAGEIIFDPAIPADYYATLAICLAATNQWNLAKEYIQEAIRRTPAEEKDTMKRYRGYLIKFEKKQPIIVGRTRVEVA